MMHLRAIRFRCNALATSGGEEQPEGLPCQALNGENGAPYLAALKHVRTCVYQSYPCPFRCWTRDSSLDTQAIPGRQLEEHLKECEAYEIACDICSLAYLRAEASSHDCDAALRAELERETTALRQV